MDSLVKNCSSESEICVVFYNIFHTFHENQTFHFQALSNRLQRTLCSDSRNRLLFLFYEDKHLSKQMVSYLTPAQSTKTKMTAHWLSGYEVFVQLGTFEFTLRLKVSTFVKMCFFISGLKQNVYEKFCVLSSDSGCCSYFMNILPRVVEHTPEGRWTHSRR